MFPRSCITGFLAIYAIICRFDVTMPTCQVSKERTSQMQQLNSGKLSASKMYTIVIKKASHCSAQCLRETDCIYLTRNTDGTNCTLYTSGSTSFDVSQLLTYAVLFKDVKVTQYKL